MLANVIHAAAKSRRNRINNGQTAPSGFADYAAMTQKRT
jgi:hypothetical protein